MNAGLTAGMRKGLRGWLAAALLLAWPAASRAETPAVPPALTTLAQTRVDAIARRLLLASADLCAEQRSDFGLVTTPPSANSWGAPIARVWPASPADRFGLRAGDRVQAVNGVPWSADAGERQRFAEALAAADTAPRVTLAFERDGRREVVTLPGEPRCHAEVRVSVQPFVNATAAGRTIVLGGGLVRLLADDAELAYAVAHEAAHIVLGHTAPAWRSAAGDPAQRRALEREADAMAVRLMSAAGYAAAAASTAWAKVADANRPPLARLMDLHGPYMSTPERTAFLAAEAARLAPGHGLAARLSR